MEAFLNASKLALSNLSSFQEIKVVLGNGTCDLDSAICALAVAFFYYHKLSDNEKKIVAVIPVMNILEKEFRVKTEVVWFLRENGILLNLITFRDQIDLYALAREKRLQLTLVDHHTLVKQDSQLLNSVVEIIDHRPQDPDWLWPNAKVTLNPVGSCATLVAKNILTNNPMIMDLQLRNLLRGPILVDTHNLSVKAGRAKSLDFQVIHDLESIDALSILEPREDIHSRILRAKTDISELTAQDLLIKDLKIVDDVAIPAFPILVQEFIELPRALEDVLSFTREKPFSLTILLGMEFKDEKMSRDIGIFFPSTVQAEHELGTRIVSVLEKSIDPSLGLHPLKNKQYEAPEAQEKGYKFILFRQENVQATRKHILPIIQKALAEFRCQC